MPDWAVPAPTDGETDIAFTDYPKDYKVNGNPNAANRLLDIRKIDGSITPTDQFFFIQHYNRPEIDGNSYRPKFPVFLPSVTPQLKPQRFEPIGVR